MTYPEYALLSNQLDETVLNGANGIALTIGGDVAEITDMTLIIGGGTMSLGEGVDWIEQRLQLQKSIEGDKEVPLIEREH